MSTELNQEDLDRIRSVYPDNFKEHVARVRRLLEHAKPGNIPWQILENQYGFSGDYTEADNGEPPKGAKW